MSATRCRWLRISTGNIRRLSVLSPSHLLLWKALWKQLLHLQTSIVTLVRCRSFPLLERAYSTLFPWPDWSSCLSERRSTASLRYSSSRSLRRSTKMGNNHSGGSGNTLRRHIETATKTGVLQYDNKKLKEVRKIDADLIAHFSYSIADWSCPMPSWSANIILER